MLKIITKNFNEKKDGIFQLSNLCGKRENNIAKELFEKLGWGDLKPLKYDGLFGWKKFETDKCKEINKQLLIIEVKKVTEGSEYGYWHALIQGMIYSFLQSKKDKNYLILCIVLDWGRKEGQELNEQERNFIDKFKNNKIFFLRINMLKSKFIEHNLIDGWGKISVDQTSTS